MLLFFQISTHLHVTAVVNQLSVIQYEAFHVVSNRCFIWWTSEQHW